MSSVGQSYPGLGGSIQPCYNSLRPYYTPGLHHEHNYTCLPSSETIPGHTPEVFDREPAMIQRTTRNFGTFAAVKYFLTMVTSPFDVGTTLLQVQYAPHESVEVIAFREVTTAASRPQENNFADMSGSSSDEDDDLFRTRPSSRSTASLPRRSTSEQQLVARSVYDEASRPAHQMAPMDGGVLDILGRIMKQPTEGWKSLFKGQRVAWLYEVLWGITQPVLEGCLNDLFGLYDDTIPLMYLDRVAPNMITLVVSHIVVGVLLSPLEVIRTRLIVQSASPLNHKYHGATHALRTMCNEEGGLRQIYLTNLIPTILYHTVRPLLSSSVPVIIDRLLHISASDAPVLYGLAEMTINTLGLIVTLPLETIRKRLQCQINSTSTARFDTAVAIRPVPYKGVLDALYKIMKEEGTKEKRVKQKTLTRVQRDAGSSTDDDDFFERERVVQEKKVTSAWGIRGLYKGFGMQFAANAMMFLFHALNGIEDSALL